MKKKFKSNDIIDKKVIEILKNSNLSVTIPRKLLLGLLLSEHGPFTVEDIINKLPCNSCDQATIYRSLNQFIEAEIVSTSTLDKDLLHYEYLDPNHHHHHIVCQVCKKIESLEECILDKIESLILKRGYQKVSHKLEFFGICKSCQ